MERIAKLVPKILKKHGISQHAKASLVIFHAKMWIEEHLPDFQEQLVPKQYQDTVLTISCDNSVAAQELQQLISLLHTHLTAECGHTEMSDIRLIRVD